MLIARTVVRVGACFIDTIKIFPRTGGMGSRGRQKPSLLLLVAGGFRDLLLPCVQDSLSFLFGKSVHVTIFLAVSVIAFACKLYLWLRYDILHIYVS